MKKKKTMLVREREDVVNGIRKALCNKTKSISEIINSPEISDLVDQYSERIISEHVREMARRRELISNGATRGVVYTYYQPQK